MVNDPRHPVGSQEIDARLHRCSEAIARPGVRPLDTSTLGPVKCDPTKPPRHSDEALQAARSWYARTFVSDRAAVMRGERDGAPFLQGYAYAYDDMRQPLTLHVPYMVDDRDHVERVPLAEGLECAELKPPCPKGPVGWRCTRGEGHDGPCAAVRC